MLHLHRGNRLDTLAHIYTDSFRNNDISPLVSRPVLVENPSLGRWLKNRICLHDGVVCLTETELPAAWLWRQAHLSLSMPKCEDPLNRERLPWRIFAALDKGASFWTHPGLDEISNYLADTNVLKRWQLAGRIADAFDRYQYYRPDSIRDWSVGEENHWQAHLWRSITEDIDIHRVALMDAFLEKLNDGKAENLPTRIDLFAIHTLPPLLLQALNAIAQHTSMHLWLLSPTPEYWADLADPKKLARKGQKSPDELALWQAGNPLLTQWGRQGQSFQDLLLDDNIQLQEDSEHFVRPNDDSLLQRVQADIYDAVAPDAGEEPENITNETSPASMQFHICHSALRECQVLHDNLLHCLQADTSLQPEDILVLVPEISRYAPYIEAVFGSIADNIRIPYNISDVIQADEHPLIQAFLDLLNLPESRFTRAEVLGLANIPQVHQRFGLEETDMVELSELFDQLRIFWGLDGDDKQRLNLPAIDENTWHQGLVRIMAGFAMGDENLLAGNRTIAPAPRIDAGSAQRAARFFDLLDTLKRWASRLRQPGDPAEWAERLGSLVDEMFARTGDDDERLEHIREAIRDLKQAEDGGVETLTLDVIRYWLNQTLGTQIEKGRLYSGGITFCAMKPLRGVPFRVIALLGMQDTAYPRRSNRNEFDRMNDGWRQGDPEPIQEDRYLFLEVLLAARDRFIISYTGRNAKTNDPLQPSVLVQELLDYLDDSYRLDGYTPGKKLVRVHPLHPFSRHNFTMKAPANTPHNKSPAATPIPSFDHRWLQIAKAIHQHQQPRPETGWPAYSLDLPENFEYRVTPQELAVFFKNPIKQFVSKRLRLYEPTDLELVEDEPFQLDGLEQWQLRDLLIQSWLQENTDGTACLLAHARGMLPHGTQGGALFAKIQEEFDTIKKQSTENNITPPLTNEIIDIDLHLSAEKNCWQLSGRISGAYSRHGLLEITASKYSLIKMLPLWIKHLCLHASGHNPEGMAHFIGLDANAAFGPVPKDESRKYLGELLTLYEAGLEMPLAFPVRTVSAFIEKLAIKQNHETALSTARDTWLGAFNRTGDRENYHHRIILHAHQWQPDDSMADVAHTILDPLTIYLNKKS